MVMNVESKSMKGGGGRVQKIEHEGQNWRGGHLSPKAAAAPSGPILGSYPWSLNIKTCRLFQGQSPQFDVAAVHSVPGSLAKSTYGHEGPFNDSSLLIPMVRTLY